MAKKTTASLFVSKWVLVSAFVYVISALNVSFANDSAGYIATGGVDYIKDNNISMQSEALYISKDKIEVDYKFKNLSNRDITHTILFPLPAIPNYMDYDFADTQHVLSGFKIWSNNVKVYPKLNVRIYMYPLAQITSNMGSDPKKRVDVTDMFVACGIAQQQMLSPWSLKGFNATKKLKKCSDARINKFINVADPYAFAYWEAQPIYSWQQMFKAGQITKIKHRYPPLVGGGVHLGKEQFADFCVENEKGYSSADGGRQYAALGYILTTGANWATPIKNFTLTVERDVSEAVSFCWHGKGRVKKISPTAFQVQENNFIPKHDFEAVFIQVR